MKTGAHGAPLVHKLRQPQIAAQAEVVRGGLPPREIAGGAGCAMSRFEDLLRQKRRPNSAVLEEDLGEQYSDEISRPQPIRNRLFPVIQAAQNGAREKDAKA
jgi:hypothetical protein